MTRDGYTRLYKFAIMSKNNRIEVSCPSEEMRKAWISMINKVCRKSNCDGNWDGNVGGLGVNTGGLPSTAEETPPTEAEHSNDAADTTAPEVNIFASTSTIMLDDGTQTTEFAESESQLEGPNVEGKDIGISVTDGPHSSSSDNNNSTNNGSSGMRIDSSESMGSVVEGQSVRLSPEGVTSAEKTSSGKNSVDDSNGDGNVDTSESNTANEITHSRERALTIDMMSLISVSAKDQERQKLTLEVSPKNG